AAALEVDGERHRDLRGVRPEMREEGLGGSLVQECAAPAHQAVVEHVLIERVRKAVADRRLPIGPALFADEIDETMDAAERLQALFDLEGVLIEERREHQRRKLLSLDARIGEQASSMGLEQIEL